MPATQFVCPTGEPVAITDCLAGCSHRCLSVRTLRAIAEQRPWTGVPSTTQLLKGTREAYLELTTDYAINPQDALFRVHGSKAHAFLEQFTTANELAEERLFDENSSGAFDFYDPTEQCLYDIKTAGSYKVLLALGYQQVEIETGEVYKTGARKGQPKTRKEWVEGGRKDRLDWAVQLNDYRVKLQQVLPTGMTVKHMRIEALVRDGGLQVASRRNITQNGILIEINKISDHWVQKYMAHKSSQLLLALQTGMLPPVCSFRARWGGRKCERYCNVRDYCAFESGLAELEREAG